MVCPIVLEIVASKTASLLIIVGWLKMANTVNYINASGNHLNNHRSLNDDDLLSLIGKSRDRAALTELYNRYRLLLGRFLQGKMSETKLVEEVYNDVMLTVWEKASNFRGDSKVSTWIFGIAYRTLLAHTRKENRHKHHDSDEFIDNMRPDSETDVEVKNSVSETLHSALIELSEKHRNVIELAYFHGYNTAEISRIVDCPQNTVKTRLFHARQKLKAAIEAEQVGGIQREVLKQPISDSRKKPEQQTHYFSRQALSTA